MPKIANIYFLFVGRLFGCVLSNKALLAGLDRSFNSTLRAIQQISVFISRLKEIIDNGVHFLRQFLPFEGYK